MMGEYLPEPLALVGAGSGAVTSTIGGNTDCCLGKMFPQELIEVEHCSQGDHKDINKRHLEGCFVKVTCNLIGNCCCGEGFPWRCLFSAD